MTIAHRTSHSGRPVLALAVWAATRAALLLFVLRVVDLPDQGILHDVSDIYRGWYGVLRHGTFPLHDVTWQYPPGAALVILAPGALPFTGYATAFFLLALLADAVTLTALLRDARSSGRRTGVWTWVVGVALGGPIVYARYDVVVTAIGVVALLCLRRRPALAGFLAGIGVLLKVWPVLLLIGVRRGGPARRAWLAAGVTAGVGTAALAAALPGAFSFLTFQRDRGTEVESLGGTVFHLVRHLGWHGTARMHYGSVEFLGPYVHAVSVAALGLSVLALGWLVWWRVRARTFTTTTGYDAAFAALLVFTVTSRVISPQYMVWLIGVAAVCLTARDTAQRTPAWLVLAATPLTTLEFPVFFGQVEDSTPVGIALIGSRNALLAAAALLACRNLWITTVPAGRPDRPAGAREKSPALT